MSIACLGELLTDVFPDGLSVPGGAPANVAFHLAQAGVASSIISRVGCDDAGHALIDWLKVSGIEVSALQCDDNQATGAVRVRVADSGVTYDIASPAAWDFIEFADTAIDLVRASGVLVFGTLAQRHPVSRQSIRRLVVAAREAGTLRFADLNLRSPHFDEETVFWTLRHADVLKLNVDELELVSSMLGARGEAEVLFEGLVREFALPRAVLTAGANGSVIHENGVSIQVPPENAEVLDTVGAGDAFTAMLARGLARGASLIDSAARAARLAAWVASSRGATPAWTPESRMALGD